MTIYNRHDEARSYNGMSLRDYFAASALTGLIAHVPADRVAQISYEVADAMLAARKNEDTGR